jgi:hypothetical protein
MENRTKKELIEQIQWFSQWSKKIQNRLNKQ